MVQCCFIAYTLCTPAGAPVIGFFNTDTNAFDRYLNADGTPFTGDTATLANCGVGTAISALNTCGAGGVLAAFDPATGSIPTEETFVDAAGNSLSVDLCGGTIGVVKDGDPTVGRDSIQRPLIQADGPGVVNIVIPQLKIAKAGTSNRYPLADAAIGIDPMVNPTPFPFGLSIDFETETVVLVFFEFDLFTDAFDSTLPPNFDFNPQLLIDGVPVPHNQNISYRANLGKRDHEFFTMVYDAVVPPGTHVFDAQLNHVGVGFNTTLEVGSLQSQLRVVWY